MDIYVWVWFLLYLTPTIVGKVRLAGGPVANAGRVEIWFNGRWRSVCSNPRWEMKEAQVICYILRYERALAAIQLYEKGENRYWINNVDCKSGREKGISHCLYGGEQWALSLDCHTNAASGVICDDNESLLSSSHFISLADGYDSNRIGRVIFYHNESWGLMCHQENREMRERNSQVICRTLGFERPRRTLYLSKRRERGTWLVNVNCTGGEWSIEQCSIIFGRGKETCGGRQHFDTGVECLLPTGKIAIRLMNGTLPNVGRVEIRYHGVWGTIADHNWQLSAAHVVCRMLNYSRALAAVKSFGGGKGPILLNDLQCNGRETSIGECSHRGWGILSTAYWYDHIHDAGVICEDSQSSLPPPIKARLVGGLSPNSGRVEVQYNGVWTCLCSDWWTQSDADVICRMLGFSGVYTTYTMALGDVKGLRLFQRSLQCTGAEASIEQCKPSNRSQYPCQSIAVVMCNTVRAPDFLLDKETVTSKSALLHFTRTLGTSDTLINITAFQVVVEKVRNLYRGSTYGWKPQLKLKIPDTNKAKASKKDEIIYVTAEVLGPGLVDDFTIGDGEHYNGYYNAPLDPECNYRVYIRDVIIGQNGDKFYSDAKHVVFNTRPKGGYITLSIPINLFIGLATLAGSIILSLIGCFVWMTIKLSGRKKNKKESENIYCTSVNQVNMEMNELNLERDDSPEQSQTRVGYASLSPVSIATQQLTSREGQVVHGDPHPGQQPNRVYENLPIVEMQGNPVNYMNLPGRSSSNEQPAAMYMNLPKRRTDYLAQVLEKKGRQ